MSEYPKKLYKSVLLIDGKIANWKIGANGWKSLGRAFRNRHHSSIIDMSTIDPSRLGTECVGYVVNNHKENNEFFRDRNWFKQFTIHEQYKDKILSPFGE